MPHALTFSLFFPKRKAFTDIHRNVVLVLLVMIRQGVRTATIHGVITWHLGRLANLSPPSETLRPHVIH